MIRDEDLRLLDLALENRAITPQQGRIIQEELEMFNGFTTAGIMLQHQYVTHDELKSLQRELADSAAVAVAEEEPIMELGPPQNGGKTKRPEFPALPEQRDLAGYLRYARETQCSDLHFCIGTPPFVRWHGHVYYLDDEPLTPDRSEQINMSLLDQEQLDQLRSSLQLDFSLEFPELGRYRCNVYHQRLGWEGAYHIVPSVLPTIEELGLPPVVKKLTEYHHGLILVTGPAGSGKTTTVAAMLEHVNRTRKDHIITIEDPIEYVMRRKLCRITQREVGLHTRSFKKALISALRHDPDVISIGEMRDLETTSIAITAAETGHLVLGTLHTGSAMRTVACILNFYPPSQRSQISTQAAESLRGVVSQQLIPRKDGRAMVLATEVLIFTPGVAQIIKDGKMHQLPSVIQSGKTFGMHSLESSLRSLYEKGLISGRQAYEHAANKQALEDIKEVD